MAMPSINATGYRMGEQDVLCVQEIVLAVLNNLGVIAQDNHGGFNYDALVSRLGLGADNGTPVLTPGTALGTAPVINAAGTDAIHRFDFTVGTTPAGNQNIGTVAFSRPFASVPNVILLPVAKKSFASQSGILTAWAIMTASVTVNGYTLQGPGTAMAANDVHSYYVLALGR